jgi:hypothetical protein
MKWTLGGAALLAFVSGCSDGTMGLRAAKVPWGPGEEMPMEAPPDMAQGPVLTCRQTLDSLGIKWVAGSAEKGVPDPVKVTLPLNGLDYFAYGGTTKQATLFMDCKLAVALHAMAGVVKAKGIVSVEHIGIYNYRCIGGGDPDTDNCTPSEHAKAQAIDLHEFRDSAGKTYNVETDWVIDPDAEKTCAAPTSNAKDALLHELACAFDDGDVFNIILTPNYNDAHRNHFHVDLTKGSDFITAADPAAVGIDPANGRAAH